MTGYHEIEMMDLETLQELYEESVNDLNYSLLNIVPWEEVEAQRQKVSKYGFALYKRIQSRTGHPGEKQVRFH
jgi:hypothetical protein